MIAAWVASITLILYGLVHSHTHTHTHTHIYYRERAMYSMVVGIIWLSVRLSSS